MDEALKKRVLEQIKKAESLGYKLNEQEASLWFEKKISEGWKFEILSQKLQVAKYRFLIADEILKGSDKGKAEEALAKVDELKNSLEKKEKETKETNLLSYVIAAALLSGVSAYMAITLEKTTAGIDTGIEGMGFITMFVDVAWVCCILGAVAAVILAVIFILGWKKKREVQA